MPPRQASTLMNGPITSTDMPADAKAIAAMRTAKSRPGRTGAVRISSRSERM